MGSHVAEELHGVPVVRLAPEQGRDDDVPANESTLTVRCIPTTKLTNEGDRADIRRLTQIAEVTLGPHSLEHVLERRPHRPQAHASGLELEADRVTRLDAERITDACGDRDPELAADLPVEDDVGLTRRAVDELHRTVERRLVLAPWRWGRRTWPWTGPWRYSIRWCSRSPPRPGADRPRLGRVKRGETWLAYLSETMGSGPGCYHPVIETPAEPHDWSRISTMIVGALNSDLRLARSPGGAHVSARESGLPKDSLGNAAPVLRISNAWCASAAAPSLPSPA